MDKILFTKEYKTRTYMYLFLALLVVADMTYGFIVPKHNVFLCFFAMFRVTELYRIKKFFSEKVYLSIFWAINAISIVGTIYFYQNNYTQHYNTLMFFMLGVFNTIFHYSKTLQEENKDKIQKVV